MEQSPQSFESKLLTPEEHDQLTTRYTEIIGEIERLKTVRDQSNETAHIEAPTNESGDMNEAYIDPGYTAQIDALVAEQQDIEAKIAAHIQSLPQRDTNQDELDL
jgi:DNA replication initiation complex subunit (GINS family)